MNKTNAIKLWVFVICYNNENLHSMYLLYSNDVCVSVFNNYHGNMRLLNQASTVQIVVLLYIA